MCRPYVSMCWRSTATCSSLSNTFICAEPRFEDFIAKHCTSNSSDLNRVSRFFLPWKRLSSILTSLFSLFGFDCQVVSQSFLHLFPNIYKLKQLTQRGFYFSCCSCSCCLNGNLDCLNQSFFLVLCTVHVLELRSLRHTSVFLV